MVSYAISVVALAEPPRFLMAQTYDQETQLVVDVRGLSQMSDASQNMGIREK
jgi:hypothetical protein